MGTGTLVFFIAMLLAGYFLAKKWDARSPNSNDGEQLSPPSINKSVEARREAEECQRVMYDVVEDQRALPDEGLPDKDAWEATRTDGLVPKYRYESDAELEFDYVDTNGSPSHRRFTVRWFDEWMDNTILLTGFCHKRKARRAFRADQMTNVVDVDTGEIIADVKQYMIDRYCASKFHNMDVFVRDWGDVFDCLFFVCRADGNISALQRAFITECAAGVINDARVLPEDLKSALTIIDQKMSPASYRRAVNRVKRSSPEQVDQLKNWAATLSALRKSGSPLAKTFIEYIDKPLAKA